MASRRRERVGALLHEAIGELLVSGIKDPRVAGVTITGVDVSPDLRHAGVYYRVLGTEADRGRAQAGLERAAGYIRSVVGRDLRLRYAPELRFAFDPTPDRATRLERLLAEMPELQTEKGGADEGRESSEGHERDSTRR